MLFSALRPDFSRSPDEQLPLLYVLFILLSHAWESRLDSVLLHNDFNCRGDLNQKTITKR